MTDLIQRLVEAIFRQEGTAEDYTNPGNLRGAPWLKDPVIVGHFWRPTTRAEGVAGAAHLVALRIAEGCTLTQLISIWAPIEDGNDTHRYIANVQEWAQIPEIDVPLWEYL